MPVPTDRVADYPANRLWALNWRFRPKAAIH